MSLLKWAIGLLLVAGLYLVKRNFGLWSLEVCVTGPVNGIYYAVSCTKLTENTDNDIIAP